MVGSVVRGEVIGPDELMQILDETSQVIEYSRQLEQKSQALERATAELRDANERLTPARPAQGRVPRHGQPRAAHAADLDPLVLRDPARHARSRAGRARAVPRRSSSRESERLTRLINDFLDLSKIESGKMEWHVEPVRPRRDRRARRSPPPAACSRAAGRASSWSSAGSCRAVAADRDRLIQVVINLLSNAAKFVPAGSGRVVVCLRPRAGSSWCASRTTARACRPSNARRSSRSSISCAATC